MIVIDTNILLYAHDLDSPLYQPARKYLEKVFTDTEPIGLPIYCVQAFLRVVTNPIVSKRRVTIVQAMKTVESWLVLPQVQILYPGERHWLLLKRIATQSQVTGNLLTDAAIAAIALEYGAIVHTHDHDFARFADVRWHNPFAPPRS